MIVSNFSRSRRVFAVGALAALLLSAGCAGFGSRLEPPQLSVVGVEIVRGDLFEQRFKARMRVQNPNDRSIAVRGVSYTLQIGGEELGRGLSGSSFTVPASGEAEFDMLVTANLAGTVMRLLERARSDGLPDSLSYRLRGEVKLAEGLVRTIPFDEKGSVRLR
jgi:LEA14-like dessication related protein